MTELRADRHDLLIAVMIVATVIALVLVALGA